MNRPKKFLFDESFENTESARAQAARKPAPMYFDEDLERARAEGVSAGRSAGESAAQQGIEQAIAKTLDAIAAQLPGLARAQAEANERQDREAARAAIAVVRKLFPRLAAQHGLAEIESLVADCLDQLREEPRIVVRIADALLDPVQDRITALAARAGFEGKIVFLAQDNFGPGDARVEWADGGAERDCARAWRDVDAIVGRALGAPPQPADTTAQTDPDTAPTPPQNAAASA